MTDDQIDEIILASGTTGERQVWFQRSEMVQAVQAAIKQEREAIAQFADLRGEYKLASAIRARSPSTPVQGEP